MVRNILIGFVSMALLAIAASSYNVTFYQPVMINGSEVKPGDYKLELKDKTAVIKQGRKVIEAPATIENDSQRYQQTSVRLNGMQVEEIRIGGTNTRVVFEKASNASN